MEIGMSTDAKKSPCLREAMTDLVGSIDFFFYSDFKDKKVFYINRDKLSQRTERPRIRVEEHRKIKRYSTKGHGFPFLNKDVTQIPHKSRQFIHR